MIREDVGKAFSMHIKKTSVMFDINFRLFKGEEMEAGEMEISSLLDIIMQNIKVKISKKISISTADQAYQIIRLVVREILESQTIPELYNLPKTIRKEDHTMVCDAVEALIESGILDSVCKRLFALCENAKAIPGLSLLEYLRHVNATLCERRFINQKYNEILEKFYHEHKEMKKDRILGPAHAIYLFRTKMNHFESHIDSLLRQLGLHGSEIGCYFSRKSRKPCLESNDYDFLLFMHEYRKELTNIFQKIHKITDDGYRYSNINYLLHSPKQTRAYEIKHARENCVDAVSAYKMLQYEICNSPMRKYILNKLAHFNMAIAPAEASSQTHTGNLPVPAKKRSLLYVLWFVLLSILILGSAFACIKADDFKSIVHAARIKGNDLVKFLQELKERKWTLPSIPIHSIFKNS
ncbi:uncharacterized protein NEMAJ01_1125 [Nematocida major]|uniref:uncharacterized protein n=1 Tax=Nematocida major TaxID=1912982 RepID=UPI002007B481|nr:uncharacterized protein NEMAJ01_1125 [Nematocida major]KAH9386229.1 hypothetical protein NEMAJ01_1125 [Nematocida major]